MNTAQLLRAIGDVDPVFVDITPIEDLIRNKKRIVWIRWGSVAACLVLIVGCLYAVYPQQRIVYPTENTPYLYSADINTTPFSTYFGVEKPYTYSELAKRSDVVVVADVTYVITGDQIIFRRNAVTVLVREVLKGEIYQKDLLKVLEPTTGIYSHTASIPMMQKGNRVLLFLRRKENSESYGFVHEYPNIGKFFYDQDKKYHEAATYSFQNSVSTNNGNRLFTDYAPRTLEEIKELIDTE